ncbi:MAG: histidine kinase [Desulfuromonadaceae bacterium GWB2_53_15]|nr:MAG: histidine kinase [Desulfuromonadales bacterium GWD2_54_10]OHB32385.1 MAG: histidine kinase [Desulfuromonadaceae bacterium GWB2_53_15]
MQIAAHCRKCGKIMKNRRIDDYQVKTTCSCGFSDYRTLTENIRKVNPFAKKAVFSPYAVSEKDQQSATMHRTNREHQEMHTLEEISLLIASDIALPDLLATVATKIVKQLKADVCNIYLLEEDELVLRATHGYDPVHIGRLRLKMGEGITGAAALDKKPITLSNAAKDPRNKVFPELNEDRYNSMLSYPIIGGNQLYGVINAQCTSVRALPEDEFSFITIIAKLILSAIKCAQ